MRLVVAPSEPDPVRLEASKAELQTIQQWIDGTRGLESGVLEADAAFLSEAMELAALGRRLMDKPLDERGVSIDPRLFKSEGTRFFGVPLIGTWPTEPI